MGVRPVHRDDFVASEYCSVPKEIYICARYTLLIVVVAAVLSHVQTHAQATSAETLAKSTATPAQTVSSNATNVASIGAWILPPQNHPWARFPVGSWREIETTTETFDEQGQVFGRSVTTQKEILKAVANDSYVIDVQATVDVAGKRIAGPWNTRVLRLSTDRTGALFSSSQLPDEAIELKSGAVNCRVYEVQYSDESRNMCDRMFFSPDVFPFVFRRETFERSESSSPINPPEDTLTIVANSVPMEWQGRILGCASQQTLRRREKGKFQSFSLLSPEVPGAEIRCHSTDFDSSGRRIRWSIQRLLAFGTDLVVKSP
jgi:hypothetical protein